MCLIHYDITTIMKNFSLRYCHSNLKAYSQKDKDNNVYYLDQFMIATK